MVKGVGSVTGGRELKRRCGATDPGGRSVTTTGATMRRTTRQTPTGERPPATSCLVRCWLEPREKEGEAPFRGYVRDLHTAEERYFDDPVRLGEHLARLLRDGRGGQTHQDEQEPRRDAVG